MGSLVGRMRRARPSRELARPVVLAIVVGAILIGTTFAPEGLVTPRDSLCAAPRCCRNADTAGDGAPPRSTEHCAPEFEAKIVAAATAITATNIDWMIILMRKTPLVRLTERGN